MYIEVTIELQSMDWIAPEIYIFLLYIY